MTSTMEDARGAGERQVDEEEEFDADYDVVVKSIGLKNPDGSELFEHVHVKKKKELTKTNAFILLLDGQYLTLFPI
jgi:hypothetical protein